MSKPTGKTNNEVYQRMRKDMLAQVERSCWSHSFTSPIDGFPGAQKEGHLDYDRQCLTMYQTSAYLFFQQWSTLWLAAVLFSSVDTSSSPTCDRKSSWSSIRVRKRRCISTGESPQGTVAKTSERASVFLESNREKLVGRAKYKFKPITFKSWSLSMNIIGQPTRVGWFKDKK